MATVLDELLTLPDRVTEEGRVSRERRERSRNYDILMGLREASAGQAITMRLREETENFADGVARDLHECFLR
ncbi:hypothetical protein ADL25_05980 [Streptomyces sp. NRRL F-5122]|nr:hypothetical protein ADL25_05980 [Streptomyces sp. NRRL F-5122]